MIPTNANALPWHKLISDIPWNKISEFFSDIDQRVYIYTIRGYFRYLTEYDSEVENEIRKLNSEIQELSLEETLSKLELEYTNDFKKISPYDFQTDINSKTNEVILNIKNNLKSFNKNFYLLCYDDERLYHFAFYNEKNIITLIEAKTAYNDVAKADIQPQLLVGIKSQSGDLYYLSNIHREINNNFTNWYIFRFDEEMLFLHRKSKGGSARENWPKIKLSDFRKNNKCELF